MTQLEQYDFSSECSRGRQNKFAGKRLAEEILRLDATVSYDSAVATVAHYSKAPLPPYFESAGAKLSRQAEGRQTMVVAELTIPKEHTYIDTATVTVWSTPKENELLFDVSRLERCWVESFYGQTNSRLPSHFTAAATLHALASGLSAMCWIEQQQSLTSPDQAHSHESVL